MGLKALGLSLLLLSLGACATRAKRVNLPSTPLLPVARPVLIPDRSFGLDDGWVEKALEYYIARKIREKGLEPVSTPDLSGLIFKELSPDCEGAPIYLFNLTEWKPVDTYRIPYAEVSPFSFDANREGFEILILSRTPTGEGLVLFEGRVLGVRGMMDQQSCPDLLVRLDGSRYYRYESRTGFAKLLYDPRGYRLLHGVNGIPLEFDSE